ncbi:MAG: extracellular solute-binding protein [Ignavibacteria bacterium]|nr:extracellular solute-binding protein [Ignavibacteria bacterium]
MLVIPALILTCLLSSCSSQPAKTEISFWHFWSEPSQKKALQNLLDSFQLQNPNIVVSLTELSWADGKAKLQLAFNSGTAPNVIHLGLDWMSEFERDSVLQILPPSLQTPLIVSGKGALWTVNSRAWLQNLAASSKFEWGLCSSDAHNVIKRVLPLIWMNGAKDFYRTIPLSATFDSSLVNTLWNIRRNVVPNALIETSKNLDEYLIRGEVKNLYSGTWMIDIAKTRDINSIKVIPSFSILNGDVLCITSASANPKASEKLVAYLTKPQNALSFCNSVSDAGFPYTYTATPTSPPTSTHTSTPTTTNSQSFPNNDLQQGFANTVRTAKPLPSHLSVPATERVVEDMIVASYTISTKAEMEQLVFKTRKRVNEIEAELVKRHRKNL